MVLVFVIELATGDLTSGAIESWSVSANAIRQGHVVGALTHMFAHASIPHLMNLGALLAFSSVIMRTVGFDGAGLVRYVALFLGSGLAGAATYLAIRPFGVVPMLGASGAICGLWGAIARLHPEGQFRLPLMSREIRLHLKDFLQSNIILFVILFALTRLAGGSGGLAWEAHLGGFLFGLLVGPSLLKLAPAGSSPIPVQPTSAMG